MHPYITERLVAERVRDMRGAARSSRPPVGGSLSGSSHSDPTMTEEKKGTSPMADVAINRGPQRSALAALIPLVFDVVVPVGLYYLLSALGVADTPALIVSGLVPFARSVRSLAVERKVDYLAVMMAGLFILSLVLVAVTGSPRFVLAKESFGSGLIGAWCLGSAWTARPLTFYTARPLLTKGKPEALRAWDHLADSSLAFRSIQQRLAIFWGIGLLFEAAVRIRIVVHYPVHTAAGLVNVAALVIIVALCVATGPLGGVRLQRLLAAELAVGAEGESS